MVRSVRFRKREGTGMGDQAIQNLIEYYEMIFVNNAVLGRREQAKIRKARRDLRSFARTMESFKAISTGVSYGSERPFRIAGKVA